MTGGTKGYYTELYNKLCSSALNNDQTGRERIALQTLAFNVVNIAREEGARRITTEHLNKAADAWEDVVKKARGQRKPNTLEGIEERKRSRQQMQETIKTVRTAICSL